MEPLECPLLIQSGRGVLFERREATRMCRGVEIATITHRLAIPLDVGQCRSFPRAYSLHVRK